MTAVTSAVKRGLLSVGHYARRLHRDRFPGVAVLAYHGVRADDWQPGTMVFEGLHVRASELDAHCRLLCETCHPIGLAQWRAARDGGAPLPARPVLVTFDDGYRTLSTLAQPIVQRYGIPAVAFVCSEPVERQQLFWHDALAQACGETAVERAKSLPFEQWQATREPCRRAAAAGDPHAPLSIDEVRALACNGIEIGAHTAAHPILARLPLEQQSEQIVQNKQALESWTNRPVTAFAYPNGQPGRDYTSATVALVKQNGFDLAFTTRAGFATASEPSLEHSRFFMLAGISAAELAHRLCHSWRR